MADLLVREVAQIFQNEVKDPRVGFVTFTGAQVSADLRHARVYYTVLGEEPAREETRKGLESATPFVRREIAARLRLKAVPELRFFYDESIERGLRVRELLDDVLHEPEKTSR